MGILPVAGKLHHFGGIFALLAVAGVASGQVGTNKVVSVTPGGTAAGAGASTEGRVSSDGSIVTFSSLAGNLTSDTDLNGATLFDKSDVYTRNMSTPLTRLVSHNAGNTGTGQRRSLGSMLIPAGTKAVYYTYSNNLTTDTITCGMATGKGIFTDLTATPPTNFLANKHINAPNSEPDACDQEMFPVVTPDGQFVVFASPATNLGVGTFSNPTGGGGQIYIVNMTVPGTPTYELVSRKAGGLATEGCGGGVLNFSADPRVSADGTVVVFDSSCPDLVSGFTDGNGTGIGSTDVYVATKVAGLWTPVLVSHLPGMATSSGNGSSSFPEISPDGKFVVFESDATNLTALGDANAGRDVFLYDVAGGTVSMLSVNSMGTAAGNGRSVDNISKNTPQRAISIDNRFVIFTSAATDLVTGQTDNNNSSINSKDDVFMRDLLTNTTRLVSANSSTPTSTGNDGTVSFPEMTQQGRF